MLITYEPFTDRTAEELYNEYVLDERLQLPSNFSVIEGLERTPYIVTMRGPVFIYFKTNNDYIKKLINQDSQSYEPYTEISCDSFFELIP